MTPTRRDLLRAAAGLGAAAITAPLAGAPARPEAGFGNARRCVLIYLLGGPSHIDMWDLKPDAPAEIRGPFKPIATRVTGVRISEHLPRLSRQMDRIALLRSVTYPNDDHPYMIYTTLTGRPSPVPLGANTVLPPSRSDYPHMGAVVARFRHRSADVPGYVAIPEVRVRMAAAPVSGGGRAGFLGPAYDPLAINDDPSRAPPELRLPAGVTGQRLARRQQLLGRVEAAGGRCDRGGHRDAALRLLRAGASRELFALEKEPLRTRERYGSGRFGQSLLLARRLVEAGVSLVAVHFNYMSKCDGWDTHAKNFERLQGELLPTLDQGVSALLDDLVARGLLDETLVVVMGEFGRTPRINKDAGRDHWGACAAVALAGGGVAGGRVVGSSDRHAAYPRELPVGPADVQATIYHCLGLPTTTEMHDQLGRPTPISTGAPVQQLF